MADTKVNITQNGPYILEGDYQITQPDGSPLDTGGRPKVALCRCGGSANKPFCDGTHSKIGFQG